MSTFVSPVAQNAFINAPAGSGTLEYLFGECVAADFDAGADSQYLEDIQNPSTFSAESECSVWPRFVEDCAAWSCSIECGVHRRKPESFIVPPGKFKCGFKRPKSEHKCCFTGTSFTTTTTGCQCYFMPYRDPLLCPPSRDQEGQLSDAGSPFFNPNSYNSNSPHVHQSSSFCSSPDLPALHNFLDDLISQVRDEIKAERQFFNPEISRKRSFEFAFQPSPPIPSSCSVSSGSPDPSESPDLQQSRAKKYSLAGLSLQELNERKKQQNKIAARRYRSRKMEQFKSNKEEISRLEARNAQLRMEEASLAQQISSLKQLMINQISSS